MVFIAGSFYSILINTAAQRWHKIVPRLRFASMLICLVFLIEIIGFAALGSTWFGYGAGHSYYIYIAIALLALPSIANLMILQERFQLLSRWYVVGAASAIISILIVLQQYYVYESLFIVY